MHLLGYFPNSSSVRPICRHLRNPESPTCRQTPPAESPTCHHRLDAGTYPQTGALPYPASVIQSHPRCMEALPIREVLEHLHITGRSRERRDRIQVPCIRIARGAYLEGPYLESLDSRWKKRRAVEIARIFAVARMRPSAIAIGRSALLIHGLDLPEPLEAELRGSIAFARSSTSSRAPLELPAVILGVEVVAPKIEVRFTDVAHTRVRATRKHGVRVQSIAHATFSAAFLHPPRMAFILACFGYRALLDLRPGERPLPESTRSLRASALDALAPLPTRSARRKQARKILATADAGCESIGEAWLLWLLVEAGVRGIETQVHVEVRGTHAFIDIAIPELGLAIEFDGRAKYGSTLEEVHRSAEAERRRERLLVQAGWTVIRVRWSDLHRPDSVVEQILDIISARRRIARR